MPFNIYLWEVKPLPKESTEKFKKKLNRCDKRLTKIHISRKLSINLSKENAF